MVQKQVFNQAISIEERRKRTDKAGADANRRRGLPSLKFGEKKGI